MMFKVGDEIAFHCDDRPDTVVVVTYIGDDGFTEHLLTKLDKMPSVTPKQKSGRWIKITQYPFGYDSHVMVAEAICSECGKAVTQLTPYPNVSYDYCPRCNAKMEVENEEN